MFGFNILNKSLLMAKCSSASSRVNYRQMESEGTVAKASDTIVKRYQSGEEELAKITVEGVISSKNAITALEYLKVYLAMLTTRIDVLNMEKTIPVNMAKSIATIMYCRGKVDIAELSEICDELQRYYGKVLDTIKNDVDPRVIKCLTPCIPTVVEIEDMYASILTKKGIPYTKKTFTPEPLPTQMPNPFAQTGSMPFPQVGPSPFPTMNSGVPQIPPFNPNAPTMSTMPSVPMPSFANNNNFGPGPAPH